MRRYRAVCDGCGPYGPIRPYQRVAERDLERHTCRPAAPARPRVPAPRPAQPRPEPVEHPEALCVDDPAMIDSLVRRCVARYVREHPGVLVANAYEDMLSDAGWGAAKAAVTWRPDGGMALHTFLWQRATFEIRRGIRDRGPITRVEWANGVRAEDLPAHRQSPHSVEVLLDLAGDVVRDPVGTAGLEEVENSDLLRRLLAPLPEREREIVLRTVVGGECQREVGASLGLSQMHVSRLRQRALDRMRSHALAMDPDAAEAVA